MNENRAKICFPGKTVYHTLKVEQPDYSKTCN